MDPAALNRMLEGRIKELAAHRSGTSKEEIAERKRELLKCLSLEPMPARTDVRASVTGILQGDGYRIEKIRFESRLGLLVTGHLYLPAASGSFPLIVSAHGLWKGKKSAPLCQARGIGFALRGLATFIVDAPGSFGDELAQDERGLMGAPADPALSMGAPWIGQYAWDLVRALDVCLGRPDILPDRAGITGEGDGGIAAAFALALEERFTCGALVCSVPTLEQGSLESVAALALPGLLNAGDFSEILSLRPSVPVMLVGAREDDRFPATDIGCTAEKLKKQARFELVEDGHDYNRRMREAVAAFFAEQLQGKQARPYLPELRPLTDGAVISSASGTGPADDPNFQVTSWQARQTVTFRDLLSKNMSEPHPEPFVALDRLVPWMKYGPAPRVENGAALSLRDGAAGGEHAIVLPYEAVDYRLALLLGYSLPEFFAQVLHLVLPGRPESWEGSALQGDAISAMIASMRTLVKASSDEVVPTKVVAEGPVSSLTAMFLSLLRPNLAVEVSDSWKGWADFMNAPIPQLIQPQARYLAWPF